MLSVRGIYDGESILLIEQIDLQTLSGLEKDNKQKIIEEICESAALMYKNNPDLIIDAPIDFVDY